MSTRSRGGNFEWHVVVLALVLVAVGVLFVQSATQTSEKLANLPRRQMIYLLAGIPLFVLAVRIPYLELVRWSPVLLVVTGIVLAGLLLFGPVIENARRWIVLPGGYVLQPAEFAKVVVILSLARHLRFSADITTSWGLLKTLLIPLPIILLVALEPDLGTALVFVPLTLVMVFVGGARLRHLFVLGSAALVLLPLLWFSPLLKDYQKARLTSFLNTVPILTAQRLEALARDDVEEVRRLDERILAAKRSSGYQHFHAMIAFGSGGLTGHGLGEGPHSQLRYLPQIQADFIFAVLGEEWGFFGTVALVLLFLILGWLLLGIAYRAREPAGRLVGVGVAGLLVLQAFVNMGMTSGALPITGLTLPFVSAGGSSLWSSLVALGLALNVALHPRTID
ncbi:MAG: FtsW/RodA/SpoVE family cell cycle protein [Planctomycetota bacterium]